MENICYEENIWDLHIHTCDCPKASSEFAEMNVSDYISRLLPIFKKYPQLKMIAFTDHNFISKEVHDEFIKRESVIKLLPGVEVDTFLSDDDIKKAEFKHVIFYFDDRKFDYNIHAKKINSYLKNAPIKIYDLLNFFITDIKVPFLMSPHFMKQGKRGFEYSWDEEKTKKELDKYFDQLFCFWETSNISQIQHAVQFLNDYANDTKISIIAFSDSNNYNKLENYLSNPGVYFFSLPTFDGLRMVGSDCRRISNKYHQLSSCDKGRAIGKVIQGDNTLFLSQKLNTIIGGRGSGKSLLIDGIHIALGNDDTDILDNDRISYIKKLNYQLFDINGNKINPSTMLVDYYNQGYILELFKKKDNLIGMKYFKDEFDKLKKFNLDNVRAKILEDYGFVEEKKKEIHDNISGIDQIIINLSTEKKELKLKKVKELTTIHYNEYQFLKDYLHKNSFVPTLLRDNKEILAKEDELIRTIYDEIWKYNTALIIESCNFIFKDKYDKKHNLLSLKRENKTELLQTFSDSILNCSIETINRVKQINCLLSLSDKVYSEVDKIIVDGYKENKFIFRRELIVESISQYLFRMFNLYFDSNKCSTKRKYRKDKIENLMQMIEDYCYHPEQVLQESKSLDDLYSEFTNLSSLSIEINDDIVYVKEGKEQLVRQQSPGTKANILMEYIVFKDTKIPLLIDQPEDNIDNSTIYGVLTDWFSSLKEKRQVIVATHDANIVVNSDAENIIYCEHKMNDVFHYTNGALESDGMISKVSVVLDGGKNALERRLLKYGQ